MSEGVTISLGGYLFFQVILLVIHYGFKKTLPWWVLWFPSLIIGGLLAISIAVILIILLVMFIIYLCE